MQVLRALMVPTWGDARVMALPSRPEVEQRTIQELVGCRYVEVVPLATDLTMWLDEEGTSRPVPPETNRAATRIAALSGYPRRCVGTVVYTGGPSRRGEATGLSDARLAELAGQLDQVGVHLTDDVQGAARHG